jgi:hypothetical protein
MAAKTLPGRSTTGHRVRTAPGKTSSDEVHGNSDIADMATSAVTDAEKYLVGSLLDAGATTASRVLNLVNDDDLSDPFYRVIVAAIRDAANGGEAGVPAVNSRLLQSGVYGGSQSRVVKGRLLDAATSGACGLAAGQYAADVVEQAQLRVIAGLHQVADAAVGLPTGQRTKYVTGYVTGLVRLASRLSALRQRAGGLTDD